MLFFPRYSQTLKAKLGQLPAVDIDTLSADVRELTRR